MTFAINRELCVDPKLNDVMLTQRIGKTLTDHYPGHIWAVNVNSSGGVVDIKAYNISTKYGYRLYHDTVTTDPSLKCIIKAGGELLERANLKRGGWNYGEKPTTLDGAKAGDKLLIEAGIIR